MKQDRCNYFCEDEVDLTQLKTFNFYEVSQNFSGTEQISLNPLDSDRRSNNFILGQVIATLLKVGANGNIEPYIADSWRVNESGLIWTFSIRNNLETESGEKITATSYVENLIRLAKLYLKKKSLILFPKLEGWKEFSEGKKDSIDGIYSKENAVVFKFTEKPIGILDYLTKVYFGYYDKNNFVDGKWKNDKKVIASDVYFLNGFDEKNIFLSKRDSAFTNKKSPDRVVFHYMSKSDAIADSNKNKIIYSNAGWDSVANDFKKVNIAPSLMYALVLNPFLKDGVFLDDNNRRFFRSEFRKNQKRILTSYDDTYISDFVYFVNQNQPTLATFEPEMKFDSNSRPLKILFSNKSSKLIEDIKSALTITLDSLNLSYEFLHDYEKPSMMKNIQSKKVYDIEFVGVDTGGTMINWAIDMMWCSNMGISFPDFKGTMCNLVNDYSDRNIFEIDIDYQKRFNQIIEDDATVIPLFNRGQSYLVSESINLSNIDQLQAVIYFNLLEVIEDK